MLFLYIAKDDLLRIIVLLTLHISSQRILKHEMVASHRQGKSLEQLIC